MLHIVCVCVETYHHPLVKNMYRYIAYECLYIFDCMNMHQDIDLTC